MTSSIRWFLPWVIALLLTACASQPPQPYPPKPVTPTPRQPASDLPATEINKQGNVLRLDYQGFSVWLDCEKRGAVKFQYNAQRDNGQLPRYERFAIDKSVPKECQQTSANSYKNGYDRGHLVPANHLDHSDIAIKQSNFMTNILPQASTMNRGAWLLTEEIVECYRDIDELLVVGGVIWGDNPQDDYFVESHGVKTPDAFWKVVVRGNGDAIAWLVPNSAEAIASKLDDYLTTVANIEKITGERLPVSGDARRKKPKNSWLVPINCNKS